MPIDPIDQLTNFNIHIKMINYEYRQTLTQTFGYLKFGNSWYFTVVSVYRATIKVILLLPVIAQSYHGNG